MKKQKFTIFDKLMLFLAICLAIGLACGILAGQNDPREHMFFAFFGLAYPFFLLGNFLMFGYWLLRGKWLFSIATVVVVLVGWQTLIATLGFFGDAGSDKKATNDLVRMMTYNVHNFKPYGDKFNLEAKEKMLGVVSTQNPDVICFQEFFTKPKGPLDTIDSLKTLLQTKYYYFFPTMKSESEAIGLAIFSKYPIKNRGNIIFKENKGNECIYVDLEVNKQIVRVYNVHFQSISFQEQDYVALEKATKKMAVEKSSSKRIVRMIRNAFLKRSAQVDQIKENIKTCTTPYIVAGDFNDTPASYSVTQMTRSLNNAFIKKGQGLGRTYNGKFPNFQIDYIATTKDIEVTNYHIVEAKLSDHFPVRSDLRLKAPKE